MLFSTTILPTQLYTQGTVKLKACIFLLHKIALCKPGLYSPTGLEPCIQCEKGFYQETEGQRLCIKCGVNTTTPEEGSNSSMLCAGKNYSVHFMNKQNAQTKLLNVQK